MPYRILYGNFAGRMLAAAVLMVVLISCSSSGEKEKAISMDRMVPQDILGWTTQGAPETYDRETIFDYIDGAGEVYLSYGFQKVAVFYFSRADQPDMTVEIFDMNKAEDAYGVFSHSRESEETGIGSGYEYQGSLICFWKAQYFVCVRADRQTPESKEAVFAMARSIDANIPAAGKKPDIVDLLPPDGLFEGSVRYFHGHPSLNYHYFLAEENILGLGQNTEAVLGSYDPGPFYLVCIRYPSAAQAQEGYDGFIDGYIPEAKSTGTARLEQGTWVTVRVKENFVILVLDAADENSAANLASKCEERIAAAIK